MVTRAIQLKIAQDLTTNGFIHVFRRFGCRRGFLDKLLFSDNGLKLYEASQEIQRSLAS